MKAFILACLFASVALGQAVPSTYPYAVPLPTNGATPTGTIKLGGVLNTSDYRDPRAVVWDVMTGGLPRIASTTTEMGQINANQRKQGMTVYVIANDTTYRLGSNLTTWTALSSGGQNLGNSDLVLTGNRTIGGTNYYLHFNVGELSFASLSSISLNSGAIAAHATSDLTLQGDASTSITSYTQVQSSTPGGGEVTVNNVQGVTISATGATFSSAARKMRFQTASVHDGSATNGMSLTLVDPATGEVEFGSGAANSLQVGTSPTTNSSFAYPATGSVQLESDTKKIAVKQADGSFLYYVPEPTVIYELYKSDLSLYKDLSGVADGFYEISDILPGWSNAAYLAAFNSGKTVRVELSIEADVLNSTTVNKINLIVSYIPDGSLSFITNAEADLVSPVADYLFIACTADFEFKYDTLTAGLDMLKNRSAVTQAYTVVPTTFIGTITQRYPDNVAAGCDGKLYVKITNAVGTTETFIYVLGIKISTLN